MSKLQVDLQAERQETARLRAHLKVLEAIIGKASDLDPESSLLTRAIQIYMRKGDRLCKACLHSHHDNAAKVNRVEGELKEMERQWEEDKERQEKALDALRTECQEYREVAKVSAQRSNGQSSAYQRLVEKYNALIPEKVKLEVKCEEQRAKRKKLLATYQALLKEWRHLK